jgi:hypothetical protein
MYEDLDILVTLLQRVVSSPRGMFTQDEKELAASWMQSAGRPKRGARRKLESKAAWSSFVDSPKKAPPSKRQRRDSRSSACLAADGDTTARSSESWSLNALDRFRSALLAQGPDRWSTIFVEARFIDKTMEQMFDMAHSWLTTAIQVGILSGCVEMCLHLVHVCVCVCVFACLCL